MQEYNQIETFLQQLLNKFLLGTLSHMMMKLDSTYQQGKEYKFPKVNIDHLDKFQKSMVLHCSFNQVDN